MILVERYINSQNILDGYVTTQLDREYAEDLSNIPSNGMVSQQFWRGFISMEERKKSMMTSF